MTETATIVGTAVQIILLIVVLGLAIVGGIGALLSRSRGGTLIGGFVRSVVVPPWPLGWLWVLWSTRPAQREAATHGGGSGAGRGGTSGPTMTPGTESTPGTDPFDY